MEFSLHAIFVFFLKAIFETSFEIFEIGFFLD